MLFYMSRTKLTTQEYSYTVLYEPVKKGGYQVTVPLLPGLVSFGRTLEEARVMARDAVICHLEGIEKDRDAIPHEEYLLQERMVIPVGALAAHA